MILGRDFLKMNKVGIDHGKDVITIKKSCGLDGWKSRTDPICFVTEAVRVEKNSERIIKCHSDVIEPGCEVLLKPKELSNCVYLAHSVSKIDANGNFYVSLLNSTEGDCVIEKGAAVGTITEEFEILENSETVELRTT